MSDEKKPMVMAGHVDSEAAQKAHPFWYRWGTGFLWWTFPGIEDVPEKCPACGEKFYLAPERDEGKQ